MIIPFEWLTQYIDTNKSPAEIAESFTALGLLLDKPIEVYEENGYRTEVLDLEHRMDRSDWLAILGCARDLAAMEGIGLKYPELHTEPGKEGGGVKIEVQCPDLVHRFNTRVFRNVTVKESPDWLKNRLQAYGIPSKNNIVDITNYVMVELGQPMHAQDLAKMEAQEIVIRRARDGEQMTTLLGETVTLDSEAFVLTQNDKPTVLGGIVGGITTGVDETTTDIVLDAGNYNQNNVRRSSRRYKIQNETVLRYDKFLHPKLTELAIQRATNLILELAGGDYYFNEDYYPNVWEQKQMKINMGRISKVGGMNFEIGEVKRILQALEYKILDEDKFSLITEVPYFRTDVIVEDDLVADVLRIYNYNKIQPKPIALAPPKEITPSIYRFEDKLRDILIKTGLNEHITDPLVETDASNTRQVVLENALTSEKGALRTSLYQTLNPVISVYTKHKIETVGIFEIGLEYFNDGGGTQEEAYREARILQVIHKNSKGYEQTSNDVKQTLSTLMKELGVNRYSLVKNGEKANVLVGEVLVGVLSLDSFKIYTKALELIPSENLRVTSTIKHETTEDITVTMDVTHTAGQAYDIINQESGVSSVIVKEIFENEEKLGKNKKAVTFKVKFEENFNIKKSKEDIFHKLISAGFTLNS